MADFNLNTKRTMDKLNSQIVTANTRARAVGLADTLTIYQWLSILNYWKWRCAICENVTRDLSPDHWLPLSNGACPGSTYDNIVPLCEGCNLSKNRTEPHLWLAKRYDEEKVKEKLAEVRKALTELATPGHPYNTTIPELAWLGDPPQVIESKMRRMIITFDLTVPTEAAIWKDWRESPEVFSTYAKNLFYAISLGFEKPFYPER